MRRIIFPLPLQELFPVLEVTETANCGTTGFAAPEQAVPGPLAAVVLGQGFALLELCAGFGLQDLLGSFFCSRFLAVPGDLMPVLDFSQDCLLDSLRLTVPHRKGRDFRRDKSI